MGAACGGADARRDAAPKAPAPVRHSSLVGLQPLTALQSIEGAVLSLPIEAGPINRSALEQRFHQRPLVNPMLLPPQVAPPADWEAWRQQQPWMQELVEQQQLSDAGSSAPAKQRHRGADPQ